MLILLVMNSNYINSMQTTHNSVILVSSVTACSITAEIRHYTYCILLHCMFIQSHLKLFIGT